MERLQDSFNHPNMNLVGLKPVFCPLKLLLWGPNTPLVPSKSLFCPPHVFAKSAIYVSETEHKALNVAEIIHLCTKLVNLHDLPTVIVDPICRDLRAFGGPALTINFWLGDRNQFIQPGR